MDRYVLPYFPYPDLVRLLQATRLSLAAKLEKNEITLEDATLAYAKAETEATNTTRSRAAANNAAVSNALLDMMLINSLTRR